MGRIFAGTKQIVICREAVGRWTRVSPRHLSLFPARNQLDRRYDFANDLILEGKNVGQPPTETLRPHFPGLSSISMTLKVISNGNTLAEWKTLNPPTACWSELDLNLRAPSISLSVIMVSIVQPMKTRFGFEQTKPVTWACLSMMK